MEAVNAMELAFSPSRIPRAIGIGRVRNPAMRIKRGRDLLRISGWAVI